MSVSDPISDMLTRIRNAVMAGHTSVAMPHSKIKAAIAQILKEEGYISGVETVEDSNHPSHKVLRIRLKYIGERRERRSVITGLERISQARWSGLHRQAGNSLGALGDGHCHHLYPQGCDDRAARPPAWCWRRDPG